MFPSIFRTINQSTQKRANEKIGIIFCSLRSIYVLFMWARILCTIDIFHLLFASRQKWHFPHFNYHLVAINFFVQFTRQHKMRHIQWKYNNTYSNKTKMLHASASSPPILFIQIVSSFASITVLIKKYFRLCAFSCTIYQARAGRRAHVKVINHRRCERLWRRL